LVTFFADFNIFFNKISYLPLTKQKKVSIFYIPFPKGKASSAFWFKSQEAITFWKEEVWNGKGKV